VNDADARELTALETELRMALGWEPTATGRDRMDRSVASAIARPSTAAGRGWRWRTPRLILVVGGALLLLGAASALTLLQRAAELMPGWRIAYERGERLNLSQTIGGYTLTLERGWVDANQLMLAFLVKGPQGANVAVPRGDVRDAAGRSYLEIAGGDIGAELESSAATIASYQVPPGIGTVVDLTATIPELMAVTLGTAPAPQGPWVFHFKLPVHPTRVIEPGQTVVAAGVPITLERVQISQTAARVVLDLDLGAVRDERWSRWQIIGTLRQDGGPAQDLTWAQLPPGWTGQPKDEIGELIEQSEFGDVQVRQTAAGTDVPSGHWTLTVSRLSGADGSGGVRFVDGPWTFSFLVP
jgi:hypothetical protein